MLELIVAKSKNNVIGKDNQLIWDIPEDLRYFKEVTMGKTIVMGRKTFESIGRPLPGRTNVILTREPSKIGREDVQTVSSIDEIIELSKTTKVVIIGGDSVYKELLPYCDILYVTEIEKQFEGDSFFPSIGNEWEEISSVEGKESNKKGLPEYHFKIYAKN